MKIIAIITIMMLLNSCKKDTETSQNCFTAKVEWHGPSALDGKEWMLRDVNTNILYKPKNLDISFQQNNLTVDVCLVMLNEKFNCFCVVPLNYYQITSIKNH